MWSNNDFDVNMAVKHFFFFFFFTCGICFSVAHNNISLLILNTFRLILALS